MKKKRFIMSIAGLLSMILFFLQAQVSFASDPYLDRFKRIDQNLNGIGYSNSSDAGTLAWSESYFMDAYLEQYKKTKDKTWLDKFAAHADTVLSKASDYNADGKLGWNALGYSYQHFSGSTLNNRFNQPGAGYSNPNLITSGSMESPTTGDTTLPLGWVRENATAATVYRTTAAGEFFSGTAGLAVKSDGTANVAAKTQVTGLKPNKQYELSFMARTNSTRTAAYCVMFTSNGTAESPLGGSVVIFNDKWDNYQVTMSSPASGTASVYIKLYFADPTAANMSVFLDDVNLKEVKYETPEFGGTFVRNGGMETANASDSTLPDQWTRIGSGTHVFRSNAAQEYFMESHGAVIKSNGSSPQMLEQKIDYVPGQRYTVSVRSRTNSSSATGAVEIYNYTSATAIQSLTFSGDGWVERRLIFDAPDAPGKDVKLRLRLSSNTQASWIAYFDEVSYWPTGTGLGAINIVANDSFEEASAADATLPNGWSRMSGTSAADAFRSGGSGDAKNGTYGLVIKNNNSGYKTLEQSFVYIPGATYQISYDYKTSDPLYKAWFYIDNLSDSDNRPLISRLFANATWTTETFSFTAPVIPGQDLRIRLSQDPVSGTTAKAYFDNIRITLSGTIDYNIDLYNRVPSIRSVLLNGSAQTLDGTDSTLPRFWSRVGTNAATAYASNLPGEYGVNQGTIERAVYGMVLKPGGTLSQQFPYDPGADYTVKFSARVNKPKAGGIVEVVNHSGTVLGSATATPATTAWATYSFRFAAPQDPTSKLYIRLKTSAASPADGVVAFDDVSVTPVYTGSIMGYRLQTLNERMAYISSDSEHAVDGTPYLVIQNDGTTSGYLERRIYGYDPGKPYAVTFNAKIDSSTTRAKVYVYDQTAGSYLAEYEVKNTDWRGWKPGFPNETRHELRFATPSDGSHVLKVILLLWNKEETRKAYFDNVDVGRVGEYLVQEALLANRMLDFALLVGGDSGLSSYSAKAGTYLNFVRDHIYPKYESYYRTVSPTEGVYVAPADLEFGNSGGRTLPYNQYLTLGVTALKLYQMTGTSSYLARAEKVFNSFKNRIETKDGDKYTWRYWEPILPEDQGYFFWKQTASRSEDVGHAGLTLANMLEAYNAGIVFDEEDFGKIINTFKNKTWNGSYTMPLIYECLFREGYTNESLMRQNSNLAWGFTRLAQFDPEFWEIGEAIWNTSHSRATVGLSSLLSLWSRSTITNGDMELVEPSDPTMPATWLRVSGSSATTVFRDTAQKSSGNAGITVVSNAAFHEGGYQVLEGYVPNSQYTLKFAGKAQVPATTNGRVEVLDLSTNPVTVLAFQTVSSANWQQYALDFTTPTVAGHQVAVKFRQDGSTAGNRVYFDDFRLLPYLHQSHSLNTGFETADEWDSTLPMYWVRGASATAGTVAADAADRHMGEKSLKLVTAPASGEQQLKFRLRDLKPGAAYKLDFYAKTNGSSAGGKAYVRNETAGTALVSQSVTGTAWTRYQVAFTAPSNASDEVQLILTHNNPQQSAGTVWFDEVGIVPQ